MRAISIPRLGLWLIAAFGLALVSGAAWASDLKLDGPLSEDECVRIALENSDQLQMARTEEKSQHGRYLSSYSGLLPQIRAGASWSRDFADYADMTTYGGSLGLSVSQSLFDLGAIYDLRQQRQQSTAVRGDIAATEKEIALGVRQQFYVCVAALRLAEVEARAAQLARDQLHRSETLFQLGSVARSDVLQAQVNVADAEQTATQRRNAVPLEVGRLALEMGLDPRTGVTVDTSIVAPAEDPKAELDDYVRSALNRRPDLTAARARLRGAEISESSARLSRLPTLGAQGGWSRRANNGSDAALQDASYSNSWNAAVSASLTLFNGLQTEGMIESAHGARLSQEQSLQWLEKKVTLEVQEAYLGIFNAREVLRAALTGVSLARENLRLQQALYESGAGTLLEWDNARLDLRRAEVSQIQAELDLRSAQAQFRRAVGE